MRKFKMWYWVMWHSRHAPGFMMVHNRLLVCPTCMDSRYIPEV